MSWRALLIVGPLLVLLAVLVLLSVGDRPLLGTNRVAPAAFFAVVPPRRAAVHRLAAGRARRHRAGRRAHLDVAGRAARRDARARRTGGRRGRRTAAYESGDTYVRLATPLRGASRAVVCVRNGGPKPLGLAGTPANASPKVLVDGRPVDALIRLEYRGADRVSWWSRIGAVARRFADGKASWVGSWTMWLALGLSLVAIVLGVVLLWRGPRRAAAAVRAGGGAERADLVAAGAAVPGARRGEPHRLRPVPGRDRQGAQARVHRLLGRGEPAPVGARLRRRHRGQGQPAAARAGVRGAAAGGRAVPPQPGGRRRPGRHRRLPAGVRRDRGRAVPAVADGRLAARPAGLDARAVRAVRGRRRSV